MSLFTLMDLHKNWSYRTRGGLGTRCFHLAWVLQAMQDDSEDLEMLLTYG